MGIRVRNAELLFSLQMLTKLKSSTCSHTPTSHYIKTANRRCDRFVIMQGFVWKPWILAFMMFVTLRRNHPSKHCCRRAPLIRQWALSTPTPHCIKLPRVLGKRTEQAMQKLRDALTRRVATFTSYALGYIGYTLRFQ